MGTVSWTAVNAFGDANAARRATARLERHGHIVVSADRHRSDAVGSDLMAIVGSGWDLDRILRMLERLHDEVAGLAIVGGPLGVLLDQRDGLTVPTLVVGERVGRRVRRRASRRLPRGSVVVRSAEFDAALDEVLTFFDRTARGAPASTGAGTARRVAQRLAPAGLVAPAAVVMLAGSGAGAAGTCTPHPGDESLIIICDGEGVEVALKASDGLILLDEKEIGKLDQFHKISVVTTTGADLVTIDESAQKFIGTAGPIVFDLELGGGFDGLKWLGSADGDDDFKLTPVIEGVGLKLGEVEHKILGADLFRLDGGGGSNKLDVFGGDGLIEVTNEELSLNFAKIEIEYSKFSDLKLTGGDGENEYKISDFEFDSPLALKLDDGGGANKLDVEFDDALIEVTNEAVSLNFAKIELDYKQFGDLKLTGGVGDTEYEISDFEFDSLVALKLDDGGGANKLDLKFDDALIEVTNEELSLNFAKIELDYKQYEEVKLTGGLGDNEYKISDFEFDAAVALKLDAGAGLNKLGVQFDDPLIDVVSESMTFNFAKIGLTYEQFEEVKLTGGATDTEYKIGDFEFDSPVALKLEDGGGANRLDLKFDDALIEVTNEELSLNFAKIELDYKQFGDLKLTGGDGDTEYKISDFEFDSPLALKLDGGDGANKLDLKFDDALIEVTNEELSLNFAKIELDYKQYEEVKLTGGLGDNEYKISDFEFDSPVALKLDGGDGANKLDLTFNDELIKISDTDLSLNFAKVEIDYSKLSHLKLTGGLDADTFEIADFTGSLSKLHLDGGDGAVDAIKLTSPASLKITDSLIGLGDKLDAIDYKLLESAEFLGGSTASKIEIANPSFTSLKLDGGGGLLDLATNDSLIKISDTEVSLNFAKIEFTQVGGLQLTGGDAANKFELDGFTGKFPLLLDGGDGIDLIKLSTGAESLKITDSAVTLDGKIDVIGHKFFEHLEAVGSDDIAHKFDGSSVETLELAFFGGSLNDLFLGGKLDDAFTGSFGDDEFRGGLGDDQLDGGAGADLLEGGEGNDMLVAGAGDDRAFGGVGVDVLIGGDGDDWLDAGDGDDTIVAGAGNDTLIGGLGRDDMNGGSGFDRADVDFGGVKDRVKGIEQPYL
jgi:type VI protein secretion system component Hcp